VTCQLDWKRRPSLTTALHLTAGVHEGRPNTDASLAAVLSGAAKSLLATLDTLRLPQDSVRTQLVPMSAQILGTRPLAEFALHKLKGRSKTNSSQIQILADSMRELERLLDQKLPDLEDQLRLRSTPISEHWQARGPGLLKRIFQLTDPALEVPQADVLAVYPVHGGDGIAHLSHNSVLIEVVLTNSNPDLPEPMRLAWLISQLNNDLPMFSDSIPPRRLAMLVALAMIPPTLVGAQAVQWARYDSKTLQAAIRQWVRPDADGEALTSTLERWWEIFQVERPVWTVALSALDRLIG